MAKISSKVVKLRVGAVVSWAHNKLWKHLAFPSQSIKVGLDRRPGRYMAAVFTHIWFSKWIFLCLHYWSESQYNECLPWRWHRGGLILPHFPKWAHFKRLHIVPPRLVDCVCVCVCRCVTVLCTGLARLLVDANVHFRHWVRINLCTSLAVWISP